MANRWTVEEEEIIIKNYPTMKKEVCKLLPHRSESSVLARARKLGFLFGKDTDWTKEEEKILIDNYTSLKSNIEELQKLLPRRTIGGIRAHAGHLGLTPNKYWSYEEDQIIRNNYATIGIEVCKQLPGRSIAAIRARVSILKKKEEARKVRKENWDIIMWYFITGNENISMPRNFKENLEKVYDVMLQESESAQRGIDVLRLLFEEGMRYEDIGNIFGVTRERIRQIVNKYIRKLRHPRFMYILKHGEPKPKVEPFRITIEAIPNDSKIECLNLSVRAYNVLKRGGIDTIGQLTKATEDDMIKLRNMSKKTLDEIKEKLAKTGMQLSDHK